MVSRPKGREILDLVQKGILVKITIQIGTSRVQLIDSHQPFVFAFITVMIISLASLIFYCAQYFLYTGSPFRNQGVDVDAENCAVCIENFKVNDLVRILPCKHIFHSTCIDPWLLDHRTCPMRKLDVIKAQGYWGEPEGGQALPTAAASSGAGSVSAETVSAVFLGEDRSTGSNLISSSSSLPSTGEAGPHCAATCAEDAGENTALLGDLKMLKLEVGTKENPKNSRLFFKI